MESQVFVDIVKFEKETAIARCNCFRRIAKLWQIFEVLVVLGMISWSSSRVPMVCRTVTAYLVELSNYLFNHHVVFLIGNAIIIFLFLLCRQNDAVNLSGGNGDFYSDYVKHSEASAAYQRQATDLPSPDTEHIPSAEEGGGADEKKHILVCTEEITEAIPQCEDVSAAIEKATRQIKRFQTTHSDKLKREICARPELRRSETQNVRNTVSCGERFDAAVMERLSSEEFRQTVDAFIDKHWCRQKTKPNQFDDYEKYQLLKMA